MIVRWSVLSQADLREIRTRIAEDDLLAARRMTRRIVEYASLQLGDSPNAGRPGRVEGTRELVIGGTPFIVPYRISGDTVEILRVYHAARKWPDSF